MSGALQKMMSFSIEIFTKILEPIATNKDGTPRNSYAKNIILGRAIFEVGSFFFGVGIIAKAGQTVGRLSKASFFTKLGQHDRFIGDNSEKFEYKSVNNATNLEVRLKKNIESTMSQKADNLVIHTGNKVVTDDMVKRALTRIYELRGKVPRVYIFDGTTMKLIE